MRILLLLFIFLYSMITAIQVQAYDFEVDGFYYNITTLDRVLVTHNKGDGTDYQGDLQIPEKVNYGGTEYSVIGIERSAFNNCKDLNSVSIPASIFCIGDNAFNGCLGLRLVNFEDAEESLVLGSLYDETPPDIFKDCPLEKVYLGRNLVYASSSVSPEYGTFYNQKKLATLYVGNKVTQMHHNQFYGCEALTAVHIRDLESWLKIDFWNEDSNPLKYAHHLFIGDKEIEELRIPDNTTIIDGYAFLGCTGIKAVTISRNLTEVGQDAFHGCTGLTAVYIEDLEAWCNISFVSSASNPLFNAHHLFLNGKELKHLYIPETLKSLKNHTFAGCDGLRSLVIPGSVTTIGTGTFESCTGLTAVHIPRSVTTIQEDAFHNCKGLTEVHIEDLGAWCSIDFMDPDSNPLLNSQHLFLDGKEIKDLHIPEGVKSIGKNTFYNFKALNSVSFPNSLATIGVDAFRGCTGLSSVSLPNSVTEIGVGAFHSCSGLKSVTLPDFLTTIEELTFDRCSSLGAITVPNAVTAIGEGAFFACSELKSVFFGNSVSLINPLAFAHCNLQEVCLPESVAEIGSGAFGNNTEIKKVSSSNRTPPTIDATAFDDVVKASAPLYVPQGCKTSYLAAPVWSEFTDIIEDSAGIEDFVMDCPDEEVEIFNAAGMEVFKGTKADISLPAGIYILRHSGQIRKIAIR